MSRSTSFLFSVFAALAIMGASSSIGWNVENKTLARILWWPYAIPAWLVAPGGPLLYVDQQGTPHYEGSPVLLLVFPVGFFLGVVIYTGVVYLLLRLFVHRRAARQIATRESRDRSSQDA